MKPWVFFIIGAIILIILGIGGYFGYRYYIVGTGRDLSLQLQNTPIPVPTPKPLDQFTFDNLSQREYLGSQIEVAEQFNTETEVTDRFKSSLFYFTSEGKRVSGQINIPIASESAQIASESAIFNPVVERHASQLQSNIKFPVIVMLRGFVDHEIYATGIGTKKAAAVLAQNGYITLAPDFLGYGQSAMPENNVWWERFNNPVQVLNLLASIKNLPQADTSKIGIWAHSNGGQIALSVLEISGKNYPTTLWAPVTKPFPFAILFFTDEFEDEGKALRAEIAKLEQDYDVRKYSITDYFDRIKAPLQIHQGTADEAVPLRWTNEFVKKLKELKIVNKYYTYPEADHNMVGSWNLVVERDVAFFNKYLEVPAE